uniref:Uncharacterized protein n=1 Tax=Siphoviridae sp. ctSqC25 TaxID=2823582 RepID=A0A8S5L666_9CAUD|nr:MAG TPA: hypothetical protein [Siphoviridae sp. ctSqC25]
MRIHLSHVRVPDLHFVDCNTGAKLVYCLFKILYFHRFSVLVLHFLLRACSTYSFNFRQYNPLIQFRQDTQLLHTSHIRPQFFFRHSKIICNHLPLKGIGNKIPTQPSVNRVIRHTAQSSQLRSYFISSVR